MAITHYILRLLVIGGGLQLAVNGFAAERTQQVSPSGTSGPFAIVEKRLVDAQRRPFLMRGTELPEFDPRTWARNSRSGPEFGAYSATSLSAIRLRFNMNTVRLPVSVGSSADPRYFSELTKLVRRANRSDLLVILAARETGAGFPSQRTMEFWRRCAVAFKDYPHVMFDAFSPPPAAEDSHSGAVWDLWRQGMEQAIRAVRAAGATQPIIVAGWEDSRYPVALLDDPNIIYEAFPRYGSTQTSTDRDAQFGFLAGDAPVLATGWDLELDDPVECRALPSDPGEASALVQAYLDYFDAHQISWIASVFTPGKLIKDLSTHDATSLENGWTCGQRDSPAAGIGRMVQAHMRATGERGLFVVGVSGSVEVARGGYAIAYGPVMAERDSAASGPRLPLTLGRISIQVTDAAGISRPAGINWASAGWGQVNFVIPPETAVGPARMTIVRADGSRESAPITVADAAPGFWTGVSCRGAAAGSAIQVFADGRSSPSPISSCARGVCRTLSIPMAEGAVTRVRLRGSGFRFAGSAANIEVTAGGVRVPVVSFGPADEPGIDQVTIEIPAWMRGLGEVDLTARIHGRIANPVRIRIGVRQTS